MLYLSLTDFLNKIHDVLVYVIGGTTSGAEPISVTFANSYLGKVATTISSDSSGILITACVMSFCLFGIRIYHSLSGK